MNKAIPIAALLILSIATTIILNGCSEQANAPKLSKGVLTQQYVTAFLNLHNAYCEKHFGSRQALISALSSDNRFTLAQEYEGVYETHVNNISFAVSPEEDGCTTDVMVKDTNREEPLFQFEDINYALLAKGYKETGKQTSRKDIGIDQKELNILEKTYISPEGEVTVLDFPLERMDKYYMTLFVEKFADAKRNKFDQSVDRMKMAAR